MPDHKRYGFLEQDLQATQLVGEQAVYVHRLALSILNDPAEADDAAQETLIAACRSLDRFRGEAQPRTWITRIAINVCRSRLRRRKVRQVLDETLQALHLLSGPRPGPEDTAIQSEADWQLWQAVDALDEKHRLPVILRYVQELSVPEIAGILGVSQGTVHSRLHYARRKLQVQLGPSLGAQGGAQLDPERGGPVNENPAALEEMPS
jgi:RNA polymerase sigma-70 factor, ECF subfamily